MSKPVSLKTREDIDPTVKKSSKDKEREVHLNAVQALIMDTLGHPDDFHKIDLRGLHDDDHFRANIYREIGGVPKMTNSYYISVNDNVVKVSPPLKREYWDDLLDSYVGDQAVS